MLMRRKACRNGSSAAGIRDGDGGALGQRDVLEADLEPPPGVGIGDGVELAVRQHREIGRHVVELARVDIEPDAEHAVLAEGHRVLARAADGGDDVVAAAARGRRSRSTPNRTRSAPVKLDVTITRWFESEAISRCAAAGALRGAERGYREQR